MDYNKENKDDDGKEGGKDDRFFIEDSNSSEGEEEIKFCHQTHHSSSCKQAVRLSRESSPPLLLAFNITSGRALQLSSPTSRMDLQEEEKEDSEQPIEEWMILGGEEQVEDSSIQLNMSYWGSSEDDSGDEG